MITNWIAATFVLWQTIIAIACFINNDAYLGRLTLLYALANYCLYFTPKG